MALGTRSTWGFAPINTCVFLCESVLIVWNAESWHDRDILGCHTG